MRKIQKKMIQFLDAKLATNGLAQEAIEQKDARLLFRLAAEACVGIREEGSNNSGPMVELIQSTIGNAVKEPWCASFVMTCLNFAEFKTGIKSQVFPTEHVMTMWNETPKSCRVKKIPAPGAITIWKKGKTSSGHTGIMLEWRDKKFLSCEGNTGSTSMNDGDGVFLKTRSSTATGSLKIVGWLKPF